ncbi:hypothetical protein ES703_34184 [subsurface metagenome]
MIQEVHKIVKQSEGRRIIIADSITSIDENNKNDVVVDGSHCGINVGHMVLKAGVRGMIGNDAGMGLDDASIGSLKFLEEHGIPAAAVSSMSAEIGVGMDTYANGEISAVNEVAKKLGIAIGMSAKEAADRMFEG